MATTDINDAAKLLREAFPKIKADFEVANPGLTLGITCVHRTPEEQFELYKKGREESNLIDTGWRVVDKSKVVTNVDGKKVIGAHNYKPARAIDVVVRKNKMDGGWLWDEKYYAGLIALAEKYGVVSGGSWKSFKDWPHIEVPDYKHYVEA